MLTTTPVSCAAQYHVGDGGHPYSTFGGCVTLWYVLMVHRTAGVKDSSQHYSDASAHLVGFFGLVDVECFLCDDWESRLNLVNGFRLAVAQFLAKFDAVVLLLSFHNFPHNENQTRALNTTSLKYYLPSTDAIDR